MKNGTLNSTGNISRVKEGSVGINATDSIVNVSGAASICEVVL